MSEPYPLTRRSRPEQLRYLAKLLEEDSTKALSVAVALEHLAWETEHPAAQEDVPVQVSAGFADTPMGQRLAITITALLPKDAAEQVAAHITRLAGQMSASGLVVAGNGAVPKAPG